MTADKGEWELMGKIKEDEGERKLLRVNDGICTIMKGNEDEHSYNIVRYIVSADFTRHAPCRQTGVKIAPFLVVNVLQ